MEVMSSKKEQSWLGCITPSASSNRWLEAVSLMVKPFLVSNFGVGEPYLHIDMQRPLDFVSRTIHWFASLPLPSKFMRFVRTKPYKTGFSNTIWPVWVNACHHN